MLVLTCTIMLILRFTNRTYGLVPIIPIGQQSTLLVSYGIVLGWEAHGWKG
jgi:hypothetical protein